MCTLLQCAYGALSLESNRPERYPDRSPLFEDECGHVPPLSHSIMLALKGGIAITMNRLIGLILFLLLSSQALLQATEV